MLSDLCVKRQSDVGPFVHCLWICPNIQQFWAVLAQHFDIIYNNFKHSLLPSVRTCLLGLTEELPAYICNNSLLHVLLQCAWKCILAVWISDKAPTLKQWKQTVVGIIPYEDFQEQ